MTPLVAKTVAKGMPMPRKRATIWPVLYWPTSQYVDSTVSVTKTGFEEETQPKHGDIGKAVSKLLADGKVYRPMSRSEETRTIAYHPVDVGPDERGPVRRLSLT